MGGFEGGSLRNWFGIYQVKEALRMWMRENAPFSSKVGKATSSGTGEGKSQKSPRM